MFLSTRLKIEPDMPLYRAHFQDAAIEVGSTSNIGGRLFADLTQRGKYYPIAKKIYEGSTLTVAELHITENVPSEEIQVFYFGEDAVTPEALSLQGIQRLLQTPFLETTHKRYAVRERIAEQVINNVLNLQTT